MTLYSSTFTKVGGLWEANVKSINFHLKRVPPNTPITFEEFCTVLVQVASILNSRYLTPLSADPNDLEVLTPARIIIGRPFVAIHDLDVSVLLINRLIRFELLQKFVRDILTKWSKEYVNGLQQNTKWMMYSFSFEIGMMIIIKQDYLPPAKWALR